MRRPVEGPIAVSRESSSAVLVPGRYRFLVRRRLVALAMLALRALPCLPRRRRSTRHIPGAHPRRAQRGTGPGRHAPPRLGPGAGQRRRPLRAANGDDRCLCPLRPFEAPRHRREFVDGLHAAFSVEAMVGGWSSEKRYFKRGIFPNNSRTGDWEDVGHYTQMIWPTTQRVGCAVAATPHVDYLVCRYATAGNIDGRPVPWEQAGRQPQRFCAGDFVSGTYRLWQQALSASPARNGPPLPRPVPAVTPLPGKQAWRRSLFRRNRERDWLMRTFFKDHYSSRAGG